MIGDYIAHCRKMLREAHEEKTAAMEKAVRANDIGLAREMLGRRDGLVQAEGLLAEALKGFDVDVDDDDDQPRGRTKGGTKD